MLNYLNEGFEGGETTFLKMTDDDGYPKPVENINEHVKCVPKTGSVLVFQHKIWHEGTKLLKGKKYIIRSDVVYQKQKINTTND